MQNHEEMIDRLMQKAHEVLGKFSLSEEWMSAGEVSAALLTKKGTIYTGICIDVACGIGFCAEHAAIAEMLKARETQIEMVVAVSSAGLLPPCGRCREFMMLLDKANRDTKVVLPKNKIVTLSSLLPHNWLTEYSE